MSAVEAQSPGRLLKPETTTATMSAVEEESPGPRIKPETTTATIFVILTSGLAGFTHAYATNAITGSLAQTSFIEKFLTVSNAHQIQAAMLSIFLGGGFIGTVLQGPASSRWGRRVSTGIGAVCLVISSALMAGSTNTAMFLVARVISGIGSGIVFTNAPVYMAEISPPHTRGLLVGVHAAAICWGLVTSSLAALGFHFVEQAYQWRLQFIVLAFFSLALLVSLFFVPESPRWLVEKERHEDAEAVLNMLHKSAHDPDGRLARAELLQIQAQINAERSLPSSWAYIIRTPHLRKRALCSWMVWVLGQSTGIVVITLLLPSIFKTLGYSQVMQFGLSIVFTSIATTCATIGMFFVDRIGRVKLLAIGGYCSSIILLIEAVLQKYYLNSTNEAGLKAATAMIYVFIIFYGFTMEGSSFVYTIEIWPTHLRSKGATIGFASYFVNAIALTTPASIAFASIGWKFYMVFFTAGILSATFVLLYFPETKGLTLEEINRKFGDPVALEFSNIYEDAAHIDEKFSPAESHHAENIEM